MGTRPWEAGKKEIEKAVKARLLAMARDGENGSAMCLGADQPWDAALAKANACFLKGGGHEVVVAFDGECAWQVKRRYSSRKRNGCYPQLTPELLELELDRVALEAELRKSGNSERVIARALGKASGRRL